jgi:general secretion pathway protein B
MSYILDALKRAEVERERGTVPGLHARPVVSYDEVDDASSLPWVWLLVAAILIAAGGAGWWWWRTPAPLAPVKEPTPIAKAPAAEAPVVVAALPPTQTLTSVAPTAVVIQSAPPAKAPATVLPAAAVVPPAPKQATAKPAPATTPKATPSPATANVATVAAVPAPALAATPVSKPAPAPVTPPPRPTVANPARVAAPPAGSGVPLFSELPDALRHQIPPLTISGAVYSDDPAQRLLLVNNQAFGQGNAVAPGVQLEEIQPNSSVFNFQGTRFQLGH